MLSKLMPFGAIWSHQFGALHLIPSIRWCSWCSWRKRCTRRSSEWWGCRFTHRYAGATLLDRKSIAINSRFNVNIVEFQWRVNSWWAIESDWCFGCCCDSGYDCLSTIASTIFTTTVIATRSPLKAVEIAAINAIKAILGLYIAGMVRK